MRILFGFLAVSTTFLFVVNSFSIAVSYYNWGIINTKAIFFNICSIFSFYVGLKMTDCNDVAKKAPFKKMKTAAFVNEKRVCVKEITPRNLTEISKAAGNNSSDYSNKSERPNAPRKRTEKVATDSSHAVSTLGKPANTLTSSAVSKSEQVFDGSKCNFTLNFINSNCIIQDNGLVLPKQYPSAQFKNCLSFYLQEGYSLPFKLQQDFFNYISSGKGFAEYANGKSDWSRLPNISKSSSRMSIWKPMVRPMSVQFENQSLISSLEARDFLLGLDSLDLGRLQSLIVFSSRSEKIGKKGKVMVTVSFDGNRQTCAINLGSLIIPQFTDKVLLKKQIFELLKNDNPLKEKKSKFNDSRKEKNETVITTKNLQDNESKMPKRANADDGKPQPLKRTKADIASSSNQSTSVYETTRANNSKTALTTMTQNMSETDALFIKSTNFKYSKKAKDAKSTVPKGTIEKGENIQPQREVELDIAFLSSHTSPAHTTITAALTRTAPKNAPQFIKDHYETSDLELMYSKFELITNRIYPTSFESCFSRLKHLLQNDLVEYIALDCEMTGLYTVADDERHSHNTGTVFKDNTKQIMDGAKVNSIFQLGLVIKIRQGGWSTWTFHTAPELTKESFTPSTFKFLFENPFMEKHPEASFDAIANMISEKLKTISSNSISHEQLASLADILINSYSPLVVYSGFADLLHHFKTIGRSVDELDHDVIQGYMLNRIYDLKSVCLSVPINVAVKPSLSTFFHAFYPHLPENKCSLHNAAYDALLTAMVYEALKIRHPLELDTMNGLFNFSSN